MQSPVEDRELTCEVVYELMTVVWKLTRQMNSASIEQRCLYGYPLVVAHREVWCEGGAERPKKGTKLSCI